MLIWPLGGGLDPRDDDERVFWTTCRGLWAVGEGGGQRGAGPEGDLAAEPRWETLTEVVMCAGDGFSDPGVALKGRVRARACLSLLR